MSTESGHILVVDDNRMNRIKLSRSLEHQGYVVGLAEGGQQALDMLAGQRFDVVLLDIIMPGMDGYQVLEQIKADPELRDLPVIVISALDEIDSAVRCIEMGAEDYLPKPFNPVLLRARLNASLQKKKLRDLEKAYLQQEVMLRQSEKLATLGKLSAGMAHELNNPAAAAQRGAAQLQALFSHLQQTHLQLGELNLTESQLDSLLALDALARERAKQPPDLDPLTRSDRE
ncbi:MAG TPA: response regulator, partial [Anaerolineae bacterium]|nr:response regulator [Anaerolineae bacterium]